MCSVYFETLVYSACQFFCWIVILNLLALWLSKYKSLGSYWWSERWDNLLLWASGMGSAEESSMFPELLIHSVLEEAKTQPSHCWMNPSIYLCDVTYFMDLFLCDPHPEVSKFFFKCWLSHQEVETLGNTAPIFSLGGPSDPIASSPPRFPGTQAGFITGQK